MTDKEEFCLPVRESRVEDKNETLRIEAAKADRQTREEQEERQMQEDKKQTQRIEQDKKKPARAGK